MTSFVKFVRNIIGRRRRSIMEEDQVVDMLELLGLNCAKLRQDLLETGDSAKQQKVIRTYLQDSNEKNSPIDDFPAGLDWLNVAEPLSLDGNLSGKVVVLDFFTYCCINCQHILPDLARLEEEFPIEKGVVVVGVHSAKFSNEKDSRNILAAAQRHNIAHPVVNDSQFRMWKKLNVHCWPTLLILGPSKKPLFVLTGEGHGALLQKYVAATLQFYGQEIKTHSLPIRPSLEMLKGQLLCFPAKVSCNKAGLLAISDSGNHRILIVSQSGAIIEEIGGREAGFRDGSFKECRFNSPQGLCFFGEDDAIIFVADTENHAIRRVHLSEKSVETVVGTGKQGNDYQGGNLKDQAISSPWDVVVHRTSAGGQMLIIAMAGTHQIWSYFLDDCAWWRGKVFQQGQCAAIAGNGREENRNNSYPNNAAFAQPSGLAMDSERQEVFLADSESSTVRKISMVDGKVIAVVGGDRNPQNLFAFGDQDGKQLNAKLQHPLGVCYNPQDKFIYVADTYNHKIKRIDPAESRVETLAIKERDSGNTFTFNEPGGLCVNQTGTTLIVANSNNHTIVLVDLNDLTAVRMEIRSQDEMDVPGRSDLICQAGLMARSKGMLDFTLQIKLEGAHFTEEAPQKCVAFIEGAEVKQEKVVDAKGQVKLEIQLPDSEGPQKLLLQIRLSLCIGNSLCFPKMFTLECPVELKSTVPDCAHTVVVHVDKDKVWL